LSIRPDRSIRSGVRTSITVGYGNGPRYSSPRLCPHRRKGLDDRGSNRLGRFTTRGEQASAQFGGACRREAHRKKLARFASDRARLVALRGRGSDVAAIGGSLRLHGPACIGEGHLHRIVADFQDRYSAVTVELIIENRSVDLIHENVDLALRMGPPADQNTIVRRIGFSRRILVASPAYLCRRGRVSACEDLNGHDIVATNASLLGGILPLRRGDQKIEVSVRPKLITNNAQVLIDALKAGKGVGTTQVLLVADELKSGALIRVLPEYEIEPTEFFLVYPSSKFLRPTVRAFIDFAVPALQCIEGIY